MKGVRERRRDRKGPVVAALVVASFLCAALVFSAGDVSAEWTPLIERLKGDRFDEEAVRALFSRPEVQFDPNIMSRKISSLIRKRFDKPLPYGTPRKYKSIYQVYMKPEVIAGARSYLREHSDVLNRVRMKYGVPKEIIVSILLVETRLGEYVGDKYAFNTLASMARCSDLDIIRPYVSGEVLSTRHEEFAHRKIGEKSNDPLAMYLSDIYTVTVNLAGVPAISVPCGQSSAGLPIGLQLIGNHFDEARLLNAAYAYELT